MVAEYFKAVWYITFVCAFNWVMIGIFGKLENVYTYLISKRKMTDEYVKGLSNKQFKKKFKSLFKLNVKRGRCRIKKEYYSMKFCEKQMKSLDIMYEVYRVCRTNGLNIPYKKSPLDAYLEAKKFYESSVETYQKSVEVLNNYVRSVANILNA